MGVNSTLFSQTFSQKYVSSGEPVSTLFSFIFVTFLCQFMFGNEVTHMTLISNKDVCENTFRPVLTHMTLLWNKGVCENKVELVRRTNETYFHKQQLTKTPRMIRNPVILRLISFQGLRRRLRGCLCAKNRPPLQTG
jgi:hypothetical protein